MKFIRYMFCAENLYYTGNWFYRKRLPGIAFMLSAINKVLNGCDINPKATIGKNLHIAHALGLVVGGKIKIGKNCTIYHNVTLGSNKGFIPIIHDNVIIYPYSIIAGNVTLPSGSVIPARTTLITTKPFVWKGKQSIKQLKKIMKERGVDYE